MNVDYQAPADAGTYTVTAHVGETANYTAHEVSATFTIGKADLTITADKLQRQQYGAYPEMVATYEGLATDGVAPDTSLRDVQIQPEFATDWDNFAQDHVGSYIITPSSALAKNYNITYVAGKYAVTAEDPSPPWPSTACPTTARRRRRTSSTTAIPSSSTPTATRWTTLSATPAC